MIVFALCFLFYVKYSKFANIHPLCISLIAFFTYGFLISVASGNLIDSMSYYIRLISFALLIDAIRSLVNKHGDIALRYIGFFILCIATLYLCEILVDQINNNVKYHNGSFRHDASMNSPIGFSSSAIVMMLGSLYFWLNSHRRIYLYASLLFITFIFLSSTRSIFAMSLLYFAFAVFLHRGFRLRFLFLTLGSILGVLSIDSLLGVLSIDSLIAKQNLLTRYLYVFDGYYNIDSDGSSLFRLFILNTYLDKISLEQVVIGLGLGSFPVWFLSVTGFPGVGPHFELLFILAEFGMVNTTIYFCSMFYFLFKGFRLFSGNRALQFLNTSIITFHMFALQFANPFYFYQTYVPYAVFFGLLLSKYSSQRYENGKL